MSASNWIVCPRCKADDAARRKRHEELIGKSYGNVSQERYAKLCQDLKDWPEPAEEMREDWELGMSEDGTFFVSYRCVCGECGFEHRFQHEEKVDLTKVERR